MDPSIDLKIAEATREINAYAALLVLLNKKRLVVTQRAKFLDESGKKAVEAKTKKYIDAYVVIQTRRMCKLVIDYVSFSIEKQMLDRKPGEPTDKMTDFERCSLMVARKKFELEVLLQVELAVRRMMGNPEAQELKALRVLLASRSNDSMNSGLFILRERTIPTLRSEIEDLEKIRSIYQEVECEEALKK